MKALLLVDEADDKIRLGKIVNPKVESNDVLIKMQSAALNHRDQWCREGMYPAIEYGSVLGSDGCGIVVEVGNKVDECWINKTVIVNPNINWGDDPNVQSDAYQILGMPVNGTFAEYLVVPIHRIKEKPKHLSTENAAALPLGGLTAYRAVFNKGQVKAGSKVFVSGIGGGVAQFAFQFCKAVGAEVYTNTGSDVKKKQALELGAKAVFNYKDEDWVNQSIKATGEFDVIIDSAGGNNMNHHLKMIKRGGNIVYYGSTTGMPKNFDIFRLFFSQAAIHGSTMGSDIEFEKMLDFVDTHKINPIVDSVRPFEEIVSAFDEMKAGKQFGKLVMKF
jgi:zinc-binding alcohol dehydrogenase/oxidoreductase